MNRPLRKKTKPKRHRSAMLREYQTYIINDWRMNEFMDMLEEAEKNTFSG